MSAVNKKTWSDFRKSGLLWWINMQLHLFGWAIVVDIEDEEIKEVYPARVIYRGFCEGINDNGYSAVTKHIQDNIQELVKETEQE